MRYTVRTSVVDVLGYIWMPNTKAAQSLTLTNHDVANMIDNDGAITRDSVQEWLDTHAGDFSSVLDFSASIEHGDETVEIPWFAEEWRYEFGDLMWPEDDES